MDRAKSRMIAPGGLDPDQDYGTLSRRNGNRRSRSEVVKSLVGREEVEVGGDDEGEEGVSESGGSDYPGGEESDWAADELLGRGEGSKGNCGKGPKRRRAPCRFRDVVEYTPPTPLASRFLIDLSNGCRDGEHGLNAFVDRLVKIYEGQGEGDNACER